MMTLRLLRIRAKNAIIQSIFSVNTCRHFDSKAVIYRSCRGSEGIFTWVNFGSYQRYLHFCCVNLLLKH